MSRSESVIPSGASANRDLDMGATDANLESLAMHVAEASQPDEYVADDAAGEDTAANSLAQDPELVQEFVVEAREHLAAVEAGVLELERDVRSQATLNGIFRGFHTIKGLAGFLDYESIQEVAHEVETLLDLARTGSLVLNSARIDVILAAGDFIGSWLRHIERTQSGRRSATPGRGSELIERVRSVIQPGEEATQEGASEAGPTDGATPSPVEKGEPEGGPAREKTGTKSGAAVVKVDTGKLEYLVDMVGELVIAQSMLRHNPEFEGLKAPRIQRDLTQLGRVTAEVQKTAMAMRMVEVGQMFRRMTRLVRDLARKSGKLADLELVGEDVELDRTIIEELSDPLVHMLRNSMDHGMESPEEREAAGKPRRGRVQLKASHLAGQILIEVCDDGRGLDRDRIFRKAVERGIVDAAAQLTDSEVYHLIFEPGFSTAEKVTDVSGRGVGMDVVRRHVEKLRGRIEIESTPGVGTRFMLKLPLTLAIIDGLVVVVGGERYIVPLFSVREMFKATAETVFSVEGKVEMALVRERLLPVVRLAQRFGLESQPGHSCEGVMIVGECEGSQFCLLVDELAGKQEVVIKSLGETFRNIRGVAGGAILGDGRVGLILDLAAILRPEAARAATS